MALSKIRSDSLEDTAVHGVRNLIINGAMQVAQRGTSAAGQTSVDGYPCVDRFKVQADSSGTFTFSQSTTAPDGFANSLKVECTTADASPNYLLIFQRMEGQNLQQLKKGTANAESLTLSFWVRSSKTGTYQTNLRDHDNGRVIGQSYTISSANTWEHKSITFAGDTTGALGNDNGNSFAVEWWLAAGATYTGGAVPTAWEAFNNPDRAAALTGAIGASTSDDFYITGVQLEVGSTATPFEHRSYGDELARCQRYFEKSFSDGTAPGTTTITGVIRFRAASSSVEFPLSFLVKKRSAPTVTLYSYATGASGNIRDISASSDGAASVASIGEIWCFPVKNTGGSDGNQYGIHFTADAEL